MIPMIILSGCRADELENRCFPMVAVVDWDDAREKTAFAYTFPSPHLEQDKSKTTEKVDTAYSYGEDFSRARSSYRGQLDKKADENHLKVFVMGESFLQNQKAYTKMLNFLREKEVFPRNTYVCVMKDPGELLKMQGELSSDAGTYLEEFLKNQKKERGGHPVTIGQLMDDALNQRKKYGVPYLTLEGGRVKWEGVYRIDGGVIKNKSSVNRTEK